MMDDEDFKQTVLDYFGMVETQRFRIIMSELADVKANNEALKAELGILKTSTHEALAVLKDTAAAGHTAVMDAIVADQKDLLTMVKDTNGEIKSAIGAVPVPGVTPAA